MPTVLREGPYRFYFYSSDRREPPHVHIRRNACNAKIWLMPVQLHYSAGFSRRETVRLIALVWEHHTRLMEAWDDYLAH